MTGRHGVGQARLCARRRSIGSLLLLLSVAGWAKPLTLEIEGVKDGLLDNVEQFLSIARHRDQEVVAKASEASDKKSTVSSFELRRLHRRATEEIQSALAPFGYYQPTIEPTLSQNDERWLARYVIDLGNRTRLGEVTIRVDGEGSEFPGLKRALSNVQLKRGDPLLHSKYEAAKNSLYETAYRSGFIFAKWSANRVRVKPDRETADIELILQTGPRYYFGDVSFEQEILKPELLHRYVQFRPGDPYDTEQLLNLQLALGDTQYFSRVEVNPMQQRAGDDRRIPVVVNTAPRVPQEYTIGGGFGTDTGPRLKFGALLRRINRSGHRVRVDLRLSAIESAIAARYEIPVRNVATDTLAYSATAQQEEIGGAETDQFSLGVSLNDSWLGFRRRVYLTLQRENFQFDMGPQRQSDLLFPGLSLTRKRADDLQFPRHGYSMSVDARGAAEGVLSDTTFTRIDADVRWVRGLGDKTRILAHGGVGVLDTSSFTKLPPSQRFFTGGDRSVRGYGFQEIGERNADGAVIGGEYQVLGSIEFEYLFYKDYGAAVFVDAGDAFRDTPDLKKGAGLGFRWRSPIGMVRVDLAHPFDDPDSNFSFHISIGPDL